MRLRAVPLIAGILALPGLDRAQNSAPIDLTQVSVEDLMNITGTSVVRKEQRLSRTAAAVFVITQAQVKQ